MGIYIFDENTGTWVLADATVLQVVPWGPMVKVGGEWIMAFEWLNVTLSIPHLSTYAVGIINLPPALSSPADVAYLGGSTGHAITWQVTDDTTSSPTYTITRDGLLVGSGAWPGNNIISIPVDGLAPGAFNYTLVVDDGRHATASDSVMVVVDNFAPVLSAPVEIIYTWGTTGHAITWHVTDDSFQDPTYTISRDGTVIASGAWLATNMISWDVDGLAVGTYWYRVDVFDGLTGTASDEVVVTVLNTLPVLSTPPDITYEYGSSAPSIAWTVADETVLAGTYTITLGGFPVANGTWASGDTIAWAPGDLLPGTWTATLTVADGYGGTVSDAATITVTNTPLVITGPHSAIFEAGNASAGVWVTITDPSAASDAAYGIFRNGTRVASGRWASSGSIYVDLRFTPPGRNDIQVVAWDGLGGVATHSILATTTNMAPVVIAPAPVTFEVGTATPILQWTITDESAENATYAITINGTTFANSTWVSGDVISLAVGGWMPGLYNVTLTAADGWGAVVENGTLVMVTNAAPVVLAPLAINYEAGDPRPVASFVITDMSALNPSYAAYLNGSLVSSGTWASGVAVTINASCLAPGAYILALAATDGYGATSVNATSITVRPDDDTSCDIADLACSATPNEVTVTLSLVDPSGYAGLNYFHVDGATPAGITLTIEGTRATVTFPNAFGPGLHVVEFSLTDGDNDWPGDGAVGIFTCTFRNGPDVQPLLDLVDAGIVLVWNSSNADWCKPAANRKAEMASELGDLRAMLEAGNYSAAYDLLLHDLKPKLTGLKTDEHEVPWGNGAFKEAWVTSAALQEQFRLWANALLQGIEDIQVPVPLVINPQVDPGNNTEPGVVATRGEPAPANMVFLVLLGVIVALGVACGMLRKKYVR